MPFDAAQLLAADKVHDELSQELDFALLGEQPVDQVAARSALGSAKADLTEAFTLVGILDGEISDPTQQLHTTTRINYLAGRANAALQAARGAINPAPQVTDLFAAIKVRIDTLESQLAEVNTSVAQLSSMFPALVRPIQDHLGEVAALLARARADGQAGEAASFANDMSSAVVRKQSAEQLLDRAQTILHEDLRRLQAAPAPNPAPGHAAGPLPHNHFSQPVPHNQFAQPGPGQFAGHPQQVATGQLGLGHPVGGSPFGPAAALPAGVEFGRGWGGTPEQWLTMLGPYLMPGEVLRSVTSGIADLFSKDNWRLLAFTDTRMICVGDSAGLRFAISYPELLNFNITDADFLTVTTPAGNIKVCRFHDDDMSMINRLFRR